MVKQISKHCVCNMYFSYFCILLFHTYDRTVTIHSCVLLVLLRNSVVIGNLYICLWEWRFWQQCCWRFKCSAMLHVLLCKKFVAKQYYILEDLNHLYIIYFSALSDISTLYTCLSILDTLKSLKCHTFFNSLLCVCVFVYVHVLYHHLRLN